MTITMTAATLNSVYEIKFIAIINLFLGVFPRFSAGFAMKFWPRPHDHFRCLRKLLKLPDGLC